MRIQTRLFLGTATLVLALMALQWWLYARQLRSIEDEVTRVATTVGTRVLSAERAIFGEALISGHYNMWVDADGEAKIEAEAGTTHDAEHDTDVQIMMVPHAPKTRVGRAGRKTGHPTRVRETRRRGRGRKDRVGDRIP